MKAINNADPVKVINLKTGQERWFAPHLANDAKYMRSVGFRLADVPKKFEPLNIAIETITEQANEVVDEFNQPQEEKPKRGRKPSKNQ